MEADQLPATRRGNAWFWRLMKEGENGIQLWSRLPTVPDWVTYDQVVAWSNMSTHRRCVIILFEAIDGWAVGSLENPSLDNLE